MRVEPLQVNVLLGFTVVVVFVLIALTVVVRITVDDYDKYVTKAKAEMDELDRKLVEFTNNDKSFVVTSEYLLRLAANATLNEKRLQLPLLKPFMALHSGLKSQNWLAVVNDLRSLYLSRMTSSGQL